MLRDEGRGRKMDKLISELLDLPERVRKGDFVLNLSKGITEPEKTLEQYVVTPQLAGCFDDALSFVRSAVDSVSSKACYLHGSFGAGIAAGGRDPAWRLVGRGSPR